MWGDRKGLAQDFGFHGLAPEQAFEFADPAFQFTDATQGDNLLVSPDGFLANQFVDGEHIRFFCNSACCDIVGM
jgi:hypothetical protein